MSAIKNSKFCTDHNNEMKFGQLYIGYLNIGLYSPFVSYRKRFSQVFYIIELWNKDMP